MLLASAVSIAQISDGCVILSKTLSNKENHPNGWYPNHRLRHPKQVQAKTRSKISVFNNLHLNAQYEDYTTFNQEPSNEKALILYTNPSPSHAGGASCQ